MTESDAIRPTKKAKQPWFDPGYRTIDKNKIKLGHCRRQIDAILEARRLKAEFEL